MHFLVCLTIPFEDDAQRSTSNAIQRAIRADEKSVAGHRRTGVEDAAVGFERALGELRELRFGINHHSPPAASGKVDLPVRKHRGGVDLPGRWLEALFINNL